MIILGRIADDTGTQLEQLSREILIQQTYRNIIVNRISSGGEEIDLSADYLMPIPGGERELRVIVECKAYRNPVAMTDWLKFLGKVFVEEIDLNEEVNGLFIALSGVNGNVAGSYDSIRHQRTRIRLLTADELERIVFALFAVQPAAAIATTLARLTLRRHVGIELIYYDRQVEWLIGFGNQNYTLLSAQGTALNPERLNLIRPLVEQRTANTIFVDLQEEEHARQRADQIQRSILIDLIGSDAAITDPDFLGMNEGYNADEIALGKHVLLERRWIVEGPEGCSPIGLGAANFYTVLADVLRFIFSIPVTGAIVGRVMGSTYIRSTINHQLTEHVIHLQRGIPIAGADEAAFLQVASSSPRALLYALSPDPVIVTHRESISEPQWSDSIDTEIFMNSIFDSLDQDFMTLELRGYFYSICGIHEIETLRTVIVKGGNGVLCQRELRRRTGVGPVAAQHGGGHIHIVIPPNGPQPWEMLPPAEDLPEEA